MHCVTHKNCRCINPLQKRLPYADAINIRQNCISSSKKVRNSSDERITFRVAFNYETETDAVMYTVRRTALSFSSHPFLIDDVVVKWHTMIYKVTKRRMSYLNEPMVANTDDHLVLSDTTILQPVICFPVSINCLLVISNWSPVASVLYAMLHAIICKD